MSRTTRMVQTFPARTIGQWTRTPDALHATALCGRRTQSQRSAPANQRNEKPTASPGLIRNNFVDARWDARIYDHFRFLGRVVSLAPLATQLL